jgi:hypothetical protein
VTEMLWWWCSCQKSGKSDLESWFLWFGQKSGMRQQFWFQRYKTFPIHKNLLSVLSPRRHPVTNQHTKPLNSLPIHHHVVYITSPSNGPLSLQKSSALLTRKVDLLVSSSSAAVNTMSVVKNIVEKQIAENPVVVYSKSMDPPCSLSIMFRACCPLFWSLVQRCLWFVGVLFGLRWRVELGVVADF